MMRHLRNLKDANLESDSLLTIGVFDGVHLGHQATNPGRLVEQRARLPPQRGRTHIFSRIPTRTLDHDMRPATI